MNIEDICEGLTELLDRAKDEFTFDEPFDKELFCRVMKECYQHFFYQRDKGLPFTKEEIQLYGMVYAYSRFPSVTAGQNSYIFEISTKVASDVATLILDSDACKVEEDIMSMTYLLDGKEICMTYNFNSGDFKDYIQFQHNYGWVYFS